MGPSRSSVLLASKEHSEDRNCSIWQLFHKHLIDDFSAPNATTTDGGRSGTGQGGAKPGAQDHPGSPQLSQNDDKNLTEAEIRVI